MKSVIEVRDLSKRYRLGAIGAKSLRDEAERLVGWLRGNESRQRTENDFWALRDVSFDVQPGQVVGLIGRNGAGKSTLLKILSRITEPTSGTAVLRGRVASLLEVGTGFHPELTGRENIFLNGAILGMKRWEITSQFDEIVGFSELERQIDTPVKRYSSGQHVRLAFAVAAHLRAEILLLDEVLAVGDSAFQEKCLNKVRNLAQEAARSILFVSHNLGAVSSLCDSAILLRNGGVGFQGGAGKAVQCYIDSISLDEGTRLSFEESQSDACFTGLSIHDGERNNKSRFNSNDPIQITLEYRVARKIDNLEASVEIYHASGQKIFYSALSQSDAQLLRHVTGSYQAEFRIPGHFLTPGRYTVGLVLHDPNVCYFDKKDHVASFTLLETGGRDYKYANTDIGMLYVNFPWTRTLVNSVQT